MSSPLTRSPAAQPYPVVFRRAVLWLVFLAPLFYLTYGFSNWLASQRPQVGSIVFDWERSVPFVAWTIIPYWSINLFYALSLALNETTRGVDRLAWRYLTAQCVAVACFILFPLQATFQRPETSGIPGLLFAVLGGFDKPFNQAPSLHIALLVIIWDHWRHRLGPTWRAVWHAWCALIGISVLTTWQHHFIDIPTGMLLGLFAVWLFPPAGEPPLAGFRLTASAWRRRLALYYGFGALAAFAAAVIGALYAAQWLVLLWPSLALGIVALAYAGAGAKVFQKGTGGRASLASRLLLVPYRLGARINAWIWTRRLDPHVAIRDGVSLGQFPSASQSSGFAAVIDCAAEFERPGRTDCQWVSIPMLDLAQPEKDDLIRAADEVERLRQIGPVLVCCALGFQRSAGVVAQWLVRSGRAASIDEAAALLVAAGRPVRLASFDETGAAQA